MDGTDDSISAAETVLDSPTCAVALVGISSNGATTARIIEEIFFIVRYGETEDLTIVNSHNGFSHVQSGVDRGRKPRRCRLPFRQQSLDVRPDGVAVMGLSDQPT